MKNLKIFKFGGTSMGSRQSLKQILSIIKKDETRFKVVVVSAPSGVTDLLLQSLDNPSCYQQIKTRILNLQKSLGFIHKPIDQLLLELKKALCRKNKRVSPLARKDLVASFGERFSAHLLARFLNCHQLAAQAVDSRQFVITDTNFTNARVNHVKTCPRAEKTLMPIIKAGKIAVVSGFIGSNVQGLTTTLGRGGSDLTATLLGRCLKASLVELWTDSDGIMTADPKVVKTAQMIQKISYEEIIELSNFGAKVVYSRALQPAYVSQTPVKVLNTFNPQAPGTLIAHLNQNKIFSVTGKKDISVLTIFTPEMIGVSGFLAKLFAVFKKLKVSVDVIAVSEASVSVSFHRLSVAVLSKLEQSLSRLGRVGIKKHKAIVSVISNQLKKNQILMPRIINQLVVNKIEIEVISYGNLEINLMFIVDSGQMKKAIKLLHQFLLKEIK